MGVKYLSIIWKYENQRYNYANLAGELILLFQRRNKFSVALNVSHN